MRTYPTIHGMSSMDDRIPDRELFFGDAEELPQKPKCDQILIDLFSKFEAEGFKLGLELDPAMQGYYASIEIIRDALERTLASIANIGLHLKRLQDDLDGRPMKEEV